MQVIQNERFSERVSPPTRVRVSLRWSLYVSPWQGLMRISGAAIYFLAACLQREGATLT